MNETEQKLRDYLNQREWEIRERISSEQLSGNVAKELCARAAMAEIVAIRAAMEI